MTYYIEFTIKIIAALGGAYGLFKIFVELERNKRTNLYNEFKYSKQICEYIKDNENLPLFVIETGLKCMAGTKYLSAEEIIYLFGLEHPLRCIAQYLKAHEYLVFDRNLKKDAINFKGFYKRCFYRKLETWINYIGAYIFITSVLISAFFYGRLSVHINPMLIIVVDLVFILGFWSSVNAGVGIQFAEDIMKHQAKNKRNLREDFLKLIKNNE